jgi:chromosome segregation ATPase
MKEIIALLVLLIVAGTAVSLAVRQRIGNALTAILLLFALASGWTIANYDWVQRVQWEVPGFESFQMQVAAVKESVLNETRNSLETMQKEFEEREESLNLALSRANEIVDKMVAERKSLETTLENMKQTEAAMRSEEQGFRELFERVEQIRQQIAAVHGASSQLALALTRATWLLIEARDEYGAERAQTAVELVLDELDNIVGLAIEDPNARSDFVADVMRSIPQRQQR